MTSWKNIPLLVLVFSTCQLTSAQNEDEEGLCLVSTEAGDKPFPDLEKEGIFSFQMSVEYTATNANQTDFYTEYYSFRDGPFRQGRVDSHINGKSQKYMYFPSSNEGFEIAGQKCERKNVTGIPDFMKSDLTEWIYDTADLYDEKQKKGPSAMFQAALDTWNDPKRKAYFDMAYMGKSNTTVRGLEAQYWRRCMNDRTFWADYYFTTDKHEDAFGFENLKRIPLRVVFSGRNPNDDAVMMPQNYDIMSFQPFISEPDVFQLPFGKGCTRSEQLEDIPDLPNLLNENLMFSAEVVYENKSENAVWKYYNTLSFAQDVETQHLAFFYTPWKILKTDDVDHEPEPGSPQFVVFDMKHGYVYKTDMDKEKCLISRQKRYVPQYKIPMDGGYVDITDPAVLFTNNELDYITEAVDRGLKVHVFEGTFENYDLKTRTIPKVIVSHSYLQDDEVERNTVSIKNALTRIDLKLIAPEQNVDERITFSLYGLTTQIPYKNFIFDVSRCFKNDDDYLWVTIEFPADKNTIDNIQQEVADIENTISTTLQMKTELTPLRISKILINFADGMYASILILQKPYIALDYEDGEEGKTIINSKESDSIMTFEDCGNQCVEQKDECWAFSICGSTCTFATSDTPDASVTDKEGCTLYRRYDNGTYIPSMDMIVQNLAELIDNKEMEIMLPKKSGGYVTLLARSLETTRPGDDESMFNRFGNERDKRLNVVRLASRLKHKEGAVKNLGWLSYAECQKVCLDFKNCESLSFCLDTSECIITNSYRDDLINDQLVDDDMCIVLSRTYVDNFIRSPGNILAKNATKIVDAKSAEDCARACLKEETFKCASFDHCANTNKQGCLLHTSYFPNSNTREVDSDKKSVCGHYFKQYSNQFKLTTEKKMVVADIPIVTNLTLEECGKLCYDYYNGTCNGFDFCQGSAVYATSCILLNKYVEKFDTTYSPICNNFMREGRDIKIPVKFIDREFTNSYAGGIGFLCFLVGGILGAGIVFLIAYIRVNRQK